MNGNPDRPRQVFPLVIHRFALIARRSPRELDHLVIPYLDIVQKYGTYRSHAALSQSMNDGDRRRVDSGAAGEGPSRTGVCLPHGTQHAIPG